jgi:dUTP pyrophosphatase
MTVDAEINNVNTSAISSPPAKRVKTVLAMDSQLQIKKLSEKGRLPTRGSEFAAGYDVYAAHDTTIPARGKALVSTDISMAVPVGTCKPPPSSSLHHRG